MTGAVHRLFSSMTSRMAYLLGHKILTRPKVSVALVLLLLLTTASAIFYVQRTLQEIEESLPITLSKQERDIRKLVTDMGKLVSELEIARTNKTANGRLSSNAAALRQADLVNQHLEVMRSNYRFNDLIGVSDRKSVV